MPPNRRKQRGEYRERERGRDKGNRLVVVVTSKEREREREREGSVVQVLSIEGCLRTSLPSSALTFPNISCSIPANPSSSEHLFLRTFLPFGCNLTELDMYISCSDCELSCGTWTTSRGRSHVDKVTEVTDEVSLPPLRPWTKLRIASCSLSTSRKHIRRWHRGVCCCCCC